MEVVVIGLGNPLMTDEGIGVYLVTELSKQAELAVGQVQALNQQKNLGQASVFFHDLGTSGTRALHTIAGKQKAVFVDCALMGEQPGTIRRFQPEDVMAQARGRFSLHEGDLLSILELSKQLGECPPEVVIFGIEPQEVMPGRSLSRILSARLDEYLAIISAELESA